MPWQRHLLYFMQHCIQLGCTALHEPSWHNKTYAALCCTTLVPQGRLSWCSGLCWQGWQNVALLWKHKRRAFTGPLQAGCWPRSRRAGHISCNRCAAHGMSAGRK